MSIAHLDTLRLELPELFEDRNPSPEWAEDLIFLPVEDPERIWKSGEMDVPMGLDWGDFDAPRLEDVAWEVRGGADYRGPSQEITGILGGGHAGGPVPFEDPTKMPPTDALAFYLPFHYYHPTYWGVYLVLEGVIFLADQIVKRSNGVVRPRLAMQAARLFLYYHEAFHHKTECFASRLELTHRNPLYKTGFEGLYRRTFLTKDCLEEGLANASALMEIRKKLRHAPEVIIALERFVAESPAGYSEGVRISKRFRQVRCEFSEENQRTSLPHLPTVAPEVWMTTPKLFDGIANIKSRVNYVIPRKSPLASRLPFRPMLPPGKLVKKLQGLVGLQFVRHGGNHDVYRSASGVKIAIPRHPRDLGRGLVRKILSEVGLDMGLDEFLQS